MNIEKNMPRLPATKPISINNRSPDNLSNSYDLKLHTFDPDKSTPPSDWDARLFLGFMESLLIRAAKKSRNNFYNILYLCLEYALEPRRNLKTSASHSLFYYE